MTKYIPAEKLKAEIERMRKINRKAFEAEHIESGVFHGRAQAINHLFEFIISLQQEQPELPPIGYAETYYQKGLHDGIIKGQMEILKGLEEIEKRKAEPVLVIKEQEQPEVDLDAEIAIYLNRNVLNRINNSDIIENFTTMEAGELARHFYELGLNARKEE